MVAEPFTKKQVREALAGIVDIAVREIHYWTDLGVVEPGISAPRGRGHHRHYSLYNLVDFAIAKRMADAGLSLKAIKMAMEKFREGHRIRYFTTFIGRQLVVVENPNSDNVSVRIETPISKKMPNRIELDMDKATSYVVIDVTDTINRVMALTPR
jgi:DNA-binding transcriptional MerR regulator